ncbi:MAG: cyclic nucleotide-binding domain-containing protein [Cystobacterineae bacterium]|nr:cyclic nucleotide-binding domain-containing protein [Cystobacterineae bacterium]
MDLSDLREQAALAFAKGRFAKAAEMYEAYCAQMPKDSQAWIRLGDAWSRLRKKEKAAAAYYEAAESYADSGFFPRAIAACKLVLEVEPEHIGVQGMLEELYARKADAKPSNFSVFPSKYTPENLEAKPVLTAERGGFSRQEASLLPTPIPLPGKLVGEEEMPIVLGHEALAEGCEGEGVEEVQGGGAGAVVPPSHVEAVLSVATPVGTPSSFLEKPSSEASWASAMKPPSIRPMAGAFYAIEDAAKASLEERGENPSAWFKAAKHTTPSTGLPLNIPLFSELPKAALLALFQACPLRRFAPRSRIIGQGERGNSFFIICSGAVRVFRLQGGERVELAILKEGEFFGEMALLSGEPRSAFVEAMETDTQVLEISAEVLAELSRKFPQVSTALWRFYRQRLLNNIMAGSALFRPFALEDRQKLIRCFEAVDVVAGTEVVVQDGMSEGLFVILVGRLEVIKNGQKIAELKKGELFGEISLLTKKPATASVVAVERCALLKLPVSDFNTLISTHPQVLELLSRLMEERMGMGEEFSLKSLGLQTEDFETFI